MVRCTGSEFSAISRLSSDFMNTTGVISALDEVGAVDPSEVTKEGYTGRKMEGSAFPPAVEGVRTPC